MSKPNKNTIQGTVLAHGADNFLHDKENSMSYFVQIQTKDKTVTRWGKDLENIIKDSKVQIGDTVVLAELGKELVAAGDKTFQKTIWDLQKYEPSIALPNVIEQDTGQEIQPEQKDKHNTPIPKTTPDVSDFDFAVPSNIKNNYVAIIKNRNLSDQKTHYYDKDDQEQINIAFEDRKDGLHTSRQDEKTIYAMLDIAQSKGWSAIKLKGTEEFKQKTWLEASLRGIETKGYTPNEKDLAELQAKQTARTTNQIQMTEQKAPETKRQDIQKDNGKNQEENQKTIYEQLQKPIKIQTNFIQIGLIIHGFL